MIYCQNFISKCRKSEQTLLTRVGQTETANQRNVLEKQHNTMREKDIFCLQPEHITVGISNSTENVDMLTTSKGNIATQTETRLAKENDDLSVQGFDTINAGIEVVENDTIRLGEQSERVRESPAVLVQKTKILKEKTKFLADQTKCADCNLTFDSMRDYRSHWRRHTTQGQPFKCKHCYWSFASDISLRKHLKMHAFEKLYNCVTCGRKFWESESLRYHVYSHTGEKPYKCSMCGRAFRLEVHLMIHMEKHNGESPELEMETDRDDFQNETKTNESEEITHEIKKEVGAMKKENFCLEQEEIIRKDDVPDEVLQEEQPEILNGRTEMLQKQLKTKSELKANEVLQAAFEIKTEVPETELSDVNYMPEKGIGMLEKQTKIFDNIKMIKPEADELIQADTFK